MATSNIVYSTGKQYGRGGALTEGDVDSTWTNIGGPGIYIAATKINNFCPDFIARYRGAVLNNEYNCGWARACIATQTAINTDGGLYARDSIHDHSALYDIGIKSFGTGLLGNATLSSVPYVSIRVGDGTTPSTGERYYTALDTLPAEFKKGRMVLYHDSLDNIYCDHITKIDGTSIFVSRGTPFFDQKGESTWNQLIYVPEYRNLTLQGTINLGSTNDYFSDYKGNSRGHGGVIAIACSETLDLTSAAIIAGTGQNGDSAYRPGAGNRTATVDPRHGNAYHYNKLHLGQGLGSIFLLAKTLRVSSSTVIGSNLGIKANLAYNSSSYPGGFGSGGTAENRQGGWYSEGKASYTGTSPGPQGAHLFIVADKIIATSNFKLSDILATGGYGSYSGNGYGYMYNWGRSPCGRGGDAINRVGGYPGGGADWSGDTSGRPGGGAAGACFIYCNQYEVES